MAVLERRTESLSGCRYGELVPVTGTAWNTPTVVHLISVANVIDCVFLHIWNTHTTSIDVHLILNPDDSSSMASVDDSTVTLSIGSERDTWALQGDRFRQHGSGSNTATIAAYVDPVDVGRIKFAGHVDRLTQAEETL